MLRWPECLFPLCTTCYKGPTIYLYARDNVQRGVSMGKRPPASRSLCRWYFHCILMPILLYFYLSNILNAGLFIVTEYSYTLVLLLKYKIWTSPTSGNKSWVVTKTLLWRLFSFYKSCTQLCFLQYHWHAARCCSATTELACTTTPAVFGASAPHPSFT